MKTKKLVMAVVALTMSASSALAFTACNSHTHDYKWSVTTPATCTTKGEELGTCECGDKQTRPIDKLEHDLQGEWVVDKQPTDTEEGSAHKACTHGDQVTVALPKLAEAGKYTVTTVPAGVVTAGATVYTFKNGNEEIKFSKEIPASGIKTFEDYIKASQERQNLVIHGEGARNAIDQGSSSESKLSYDFGDNYFHQKNTSEFYGSQIDHEYFVTKNAGGIASAIRNNNTVYSKIDAYEDELDATDDQLMIQNLMNGGYEYTLSAHYFDFEDDEAQDFNVYGTENLVKWLYNYGTENAQGDVVTSANDNEYSFNYVYIKHSLRWNRYVYDENWNIIDTIYDEYDGWVDVQVEFTLNSDYVMTDVDVLINFYLDGAEKAENATEFTKKDGAELSIKENFTVTQEVKTAENEYPVNPLTPDVYTVTNLKLTEASMREDWSGYDFGDEIEDGAVLQASTDDAFYLGVIINEPETAKKYSALNDFEVYVIDGQEKSLASDLGFAVSYMSNADVILIRSRRNVGEYKFKIVLGNAEKDVTVNFKAGAPDDIKATTYIYDNITENYLDTTASSPIAVYTGEEFYFDIQAIAYDDFTADESVTVTIKDEQTGATLSEAQFDGKDMYKFVATEAGKYTIIITSDVKQSLKKQINVTVTETPDLLTSKFTKDDVMVVFGEDNSVTIGEFAYTYTANTDGTYTLTTTASPETVYTSFKFTPHCGLVLSYTDVVEKTEVFELYVEKEEATGIVGALVGTWTGKFSYYSMFLEFKDDGTVLYNDSMMMSKITLSYEATDNGDGTYSITFSGVDEGDYYNMYFAYVGLKATGSVVTFDGTQITDLKIKSFDTETYEERDIAVTKSN